MRAQPITITDVEQWNDTFAREFDIDDYYARSGFIIRMIEKRRLACIRRMVAARPEHEILEVGCGGGHVLEQFPLSKLTGVDVSGRMLEKTAARLEGRDLRLLKGELRDLDLPDTSYDRIICSEVIEHVVDPVELLEQIRRLLRPGGRAIITFPNDVLVDRLRRIVRRSGLTLLPPLRRISWGGEHYHLHQWTIREMRALLGAYFTVQRAAYAPNKLVPIRCCFQCAVGA